MIVSVTTITIPSSTADPNGYLARAIAASGGLKGAPVALVRGLDDAGGGVDAIATRLGVVRTDYASRHRRN